MKFRVEAYVGLLGEKRYRLQRDGSWRRLKKSALGRNYPEFDRRDEPSPEDRLFEELRETAPYVLRKGRMELEGRTYEVNPKGGGLAELGLSVDIKPKVCRITRPKVFSIRELEGVIASGDDSRHNSLVLELRGYFGLMEFEEAREELAPVAVRHETFCAGNDYVGFRAARDRRVMGETYLSSLEGWIAHLMTDELNVYQDHLEGKKSEAELWQEVNYLTRHLR